MSLYCGFTKICIYKECLEITPYYTITDSQDDCHNCENGYVLFM